MTNNTGVQALFLVLLLVLPLSSLLTRRVPIRQAAKMAAAWIVIFAVVMLLIAGRDRIGATWLRVTRTIGAGDQRVIGGEVRIHKADDGHFWALASVNGVARRMLIDSGATTTAISADTARAAQLDLQKVHSRQCCRPPMDRSWPQRSTLPSLEIGTITAHDLPVVVSLAFGDIDVIGMNFLSRLKGWRVEGDTLILQPDDRD